MYVDIRTKHICVYVCVYTYIYICTYIQKGAFSWEHIYIYPNRTHLGYVYIYTKGALLIKQMYLYACIHI